LLAGDTSFAEAIQRDRSSAAYLVPHGKADSATPSKRRLDVVFDAFGLTYDFVLIVVPPVESRPELGWIAARCASAILVTGESAADPTTSAAYKALRAGGIDDVIVMVAPPPSISLGRASA
jgi:hypothetical protein